MTKIDKVKSISKSVLNALDYLHSKGIIHADIKPENVLINSNMGCQTIKICDFGLSCILPIDKTYVEVTSYYGTIPYMAPEIRKVSV
jgi:serine/threonine protein kinase